MLNVKLKLGDTFHYVGTIDKLRGKKFMLVTVEQQTTPWLTLETLYTLKEISDSVLYSEHVRCTEMEFMQHFMKVSRHKNKLMETE